MYGFLEVQQTIVDMLRITYTWCCLKLLREKNFIEGISKQHDNEVFPKLSKREYWCKIEISNAKIKKRRIK